MISTRMQFDCCYDTNNLKLLYNKLQDIYPDSQLSINWRRGAKKTDDCAEADSFSIKKDNKLMFTATYKNSRGMIRFSVLEDKQDEVLKAIRESNLIFDEKPSFSIGIVCAILFLIIFAIMITAREYGAVFIGIAFLVMIVGFSSYAVALAQRMGTITLRTTSIFGVIGFALLAPASLLLIPLLTAISKNNTYKLITQS